MGALNDSASMGENNTHTRFDRQNVGMDRCVMFGLLMKSAMHWLVNCVSLPGVTNFKFGKNGAYARNCRGYAYRLHWHNLNLFAVCIYKDD